MAAVKQGSACVGLKSKKFAVLAALKRGSSTLAEPQPKVFKVGRGVYFCLFFFFSLLFVCVTRFCTLCGVLCRSTRTLALACRACALTRVRCAFTCGTSVW